LPNCQKGFILANQLTEVDRKVAVLQKTGNFSVLPPDLAKIWYTGVKEWGEIMAKQTGDDIVAFGMTRQEVIDAADAAYHEYDKNDEDTGTYSEYIQAMKRGREALKKQASYYPYMPREV